MFDTSFPKWKIGEVRELGAEGADCEVDIVCGGRDGLSEPLELATFAGGHHNSRRYAEAAVECVNACAAWNPEDPAKAARNLNDLVGYAVAAVEADGVLDGRSAATLKEILQDAFGELRSEARCDNCSQAWPIASLFQPANLAERIDPGGPKPAGECPSCGALCYLFEGEPPDADPEDLQERRERGGGY